MSELTLLDLIEETKAARDRDPDTSFDAVPSISSRNKWQRACVAAIVALERIGYRGVTVHDIWVWLDETSHRVPPENALSRRLTDLHRAGCIQDIGIRREGGAGRLQIAWTSTASGREALEAS